MADAATLATDTLGFDPQALREKYRIERDRRLRKTFANGRTQRRVPLDLTAAGIPVAA